MKEKMRREEKISIVKRYVEERRLLTANQLCQILRIVKENEDVVTKLVGNPAAVGIWSEIAARVAVRANFHCEYCGKYLLDSADSYKDFQIDHIEPLSQGGDGGKENMALSCRQCNVNFKSFASISQMKEFLDKKK